MAVTIINAETRTTVDRPARSCCGAESGAVTGAAPGSVTVTLALTGMLCGMFSVPSGVFKLPPR